MRIVSLVPHATEICFALGLGDQVVGVTHECDWPPEAAQATPVTADLLPQGLDSAAIDAAVREKTSGGEAIYSLDAATLKELEPDLIITQALCPVCAVGYDDVAAVAEEMGVQVNEPEVNGRIAAMAAQRGVAPAQMRQDLERAGRLSELALSIREQKVLDRILDEAASTEISADKWNEAEDKRRDEAMAKARSSKGGSKKKA